MNTKMKKRRLIGCHDGNPWYTIDVEYNALLSTLQRNVHPDSILVLIHSLVEGNPNLKSR